MKKWVFTVLSVLLVVPFLLTPSIDASSSTASPSIDNTGYFNFSISSKQSSTKSTMIKLDPGWLTIEGTLTATPISTGASPLSITVEVWDLDPWGNQDDKIGFQRVTFWDKSSDGKFRTDFSIELDVDPDAGSNTTNPGEFIVVLNRDGRDVKFNVLANGMLQTR